MNQILYKSVFENNNYDINKNKKKYIIIFVIAIILVTTAILFYIFIKINILKNEKLSKNLLSNYNITTLYSNSNNYVSEKLLNEKIDPFVIGLIQIDKISLMYPILSKTDSELLKISPCRFARTNAKSNSAIYVLQVIIMLIINYLVN